MKIPISVMFYPMPMFTKTLFIQGCCCKSSSHLQSCNTSRKYFIYIQNARKTNLESPIE